MLLYQLSLEELQLELLGCEKLLLVLEHLSMLGKLGKVDRLMPVPASTRNKTCRLGKRLWELTIARAGDRRSGRPTAVSRLLSVLVHGGSNRARRCVGRVLAAK